MKDRELAKIIIEKMKTVAGVKSQAKLAHALGIQPPSVTDAITKGKIPERWFEVFSDKFGVTKEELSTPSERAVAGPVQCWNDATPNEDREKFTQDMNGLFSIIMRWQEEENGADPLTSMQFIQLFHERIPELGEWIKKRKGSGAQNSLPENLSVAGGKS